MSYATKDGHWISATEVTRIDCTRCGVVLLSRYRMTEQETDRAVRLHAQLHNRRVDRDA